jgi:hypothetical protein
MRNTPSTVSNGCPVSPAFDAKEQQAGMPMGRGMFFYLHLFKSGGTTLATRLSSAFLPERAHIRRRTLHYGKDDEEFSRLIAERDFVESHVSGPLLQERDGVELMVTVRNPIERIISAYRHIRRADGDFHRPANALSVEAFFSDYADIMVDDQAKPLVSALFACPPERVALDHDRWVYEQLPQAIDCLRWLVPTESIDEFVPLWAIETGVAVPDTVTVANVAPPDDVDVSALRAMLRDRPELYALDLYLWRVARERFAQYRAKVMPSPLAKNSRCAFLKNESGVWCTAGWHNPIQSSVGTEHIAGPGLTSELTVVCSVGEEYLRFKIGVLIGIGVNEMVFFRKRGMERLTPKIEQQDGGPITVTLSINSLGARGAREVLLILVPRSFSPMQVSSDFADPTRRPYSIYGVELI